MQDRLKQVQEQLLTFWNKYSSKQKTVIICVGAGIILAFAILMYFVTRPSYIKLVGTTDTDAATEMVAKFQEEGIDFKKSIQDGFYVIDVNQKDFVDANLLVGNNDKYSAAMSWEDALNNSMAVTTMEKLVKNTLALQGTLSSALMKYDGVEEAIVLIHRPPDDFTINGIEDATVGVQLGLESNATITTEAANAMAQFIMNSVGNKSTKDITITSRSGDLLFGGSEGEGLGTSINSAAEFKTKLRNQMGDNVTELLLKAGFDDATIGSSNIQFNMDKVTELLESYSIPEGRDEGYLDSDYEYTNTNSSGTGGIPGTDSNSEETDSMLVTEGDAKGEVLINKRDYLTDKAVKNIEYEVGATLPEESSISVVATRFNVIKEEALERDGLLDNMTFEEYRAANSKPLELTLPTDAGGPTLEAYEQLISDATGIDPDNITLMVQTMNMFVPKTKTPSVFTVSNILMFILAALIIAMMFFVVFKSTAPVEITEVEPELSIEQLLATTKENQSLEDIEFSEKSEARKMIEKFVDEKPEAVAQLLRNWLNEDWG